MNETYSTYIDTLKDLVREDKNSKLTDKIRQRIIEEAGPDLGIDERYYIDIIKDLYFIFLRAKDENSLSRIHKSIAELLIEFITRCFDFADKKSDAFTFHFAKLKEIGFLISLFFHAPNEEIDRGRFFYRLDQVFTALMGKLQTLPFSIAEFVKNYIQNPKDQNNKLAFFILNLWTSLLPEWCLNFEKTIPKRIVSELRTLFEESCEQLQKNPKPFFWNMTFIGYQSLQIINPDYAGKKGFDKMLTMLVDIEKKDQLSPKQKKIMQSQWESNLESLSYFFKKYEDLKNTFTKDRKNYKFQKKDETIKKLFEKSEKILSIGIPPKDIPIKLMPIYS